MAIIWRPGANRTKAIGCAAALAVVFSNANAQMYSYDPANPPGSAHVYFGSTKDSDGNFLSGVTVNSTRGRPLSLW